MMRLLRAWFSFWKSDASVGSVRADHGSIAAGRDIRNSTIQVGLDEQETVRRIADAQRPLEARLAALADQVARDKGVPVSPLRAVLVKLGEANVPDYEIPARLDAAADELVDLRAQLRRL